MTDQETTDLLKSFDEAMAYALKKFPNDLASKAKLEQARAAILGLDSPQASNSPSITQ